MKRLRFLPMVALMTFISCSSTPNSGADELQFVVLDPGHFHAALVQRESLAGVSDTVRVYAPAGAGLEQYLANIDRFNSREEAPSQWVEQVMTGDDCLEQLLANKQGDIVVLAGNNRKKTHYIIESIRAGYHVLADKPLAITAEDFALLDEAYRLAEEQGLVLYELMTERYDTLNIIEKELLAEEELFGELLKGTQEEPAIELESVHHFFKEVNGAPLIRPAWYYDVAQQGEGIADVTTHLIDLIAWQCFPGEAVRYPEEVTVTGATHWPTRLTLEQFSRSTGATAYPEYLASYLNKEILEVNANGEIDFVMKGVHASMRVIWNYQAPAGSGDTFSSVKRGSKATLRTVQDASTGFVKELFVEKNPTVDEAAFEAAVAQSVARLQEQHPFLQAEKCGEGRFLIQIPKEVRTGHEAHFSKVAGAFLDYVRGAEMPATERANTIAKYYVTTRAVEMARQ
ncbi:MAG: Gfo/Idh/MocA family oxidoreductase [Alistipes sp.]|nr:Gfo/Idh/MocA family oxidoreductase [Alistipes sp.]